MKHFLKDVFLFFALLLVISTVISFSLDGIFNGKKHSHSKHNWVLSIKNREFDYAVLGSSRVANTVNVRKIDDVLGTTGINIATSGSNYADNYALLSKFIENRNTIKYLLLNIDEYCFDTRNHYSYPFADYEYMPYFYNKEINRIYKDYSKKFYFWKFVSFARYAEFSDKYKLQDLIILKNALSAYDSTRGYEPLIGGDKKFIMSKTALGIDSLDICYYKKIINLCFINKIKPILITTPEYFELFQYQTNRKEIYDLISKLDRDLKLPYIYFSTVGNFDNKMYFLDDTHTNSKGSDFYSSRLACALKDVLQRTN